MGRIVTQRQLQIALADQKRYFINLLNTLETEKSKRFMERLKADCDAAREFQEKYPLTAARRTRHLDQTLEPVFDECGNEIDPDSESQPAKPMIALIKKDLTDKLPVYPRK